MNILETRFKQREYDGKWEKVVKVHDHENTYTYVTDSGNKVHLTPEKWLTVGVFDFIGELAA